MTSNTPPISQYTALFINECINTFALTPHPWQMVVGAELIESGMTGQPIKSLCVRPTGGGKSLVFNAVAGVLHGVTLCICPLLSLGADRTKKIFSKTFTDCTSVTAFHLDELSNSAVVKLKFFLDNPVNSTKSIIFFASPQAITDRYNPFVQYLINGNLIRLVVVDEIHLVSHFGKSFRKEFLLLKDLLFKKLNPSIPMLFLTATCSTLIAADIQSMFGIEFNRSHWPPPIDMVHGSVKINLSYTTRAFQFVKKTIKNDLAPHPSLPNKVIVYSNRRVRIFNFADKLEQLMDADPNFKTVDALTLTGILTKEEKAAFIRMFINGSSKEDSTLDMRVLCATSGVGNAGIDSPDIRAVYRIDFPPSILDMVQERGRAGRRPDATSMNYNYYVCISLESFLYLFNRILNPSFLVNDETYRTRQINDLLQVANIFVSGKCYAVAFETLLGNPCSPSVDLPRCLDCPACREIKLFPKLNRQGVVEVLFDYFITSSTAIHKTLANTIEFIRKVPNVDHKVFRKKVKKLNPLLIKKMIFLLIASKILVVKFDQTIGEAGDLSLHLATLNTGYSLALLDDERWANIELTT